MRQERRRRQLSVINHGTMDSWDFNATDMNPSADRESSRSISRSGSFDMGPHSHHESARHDVHPRFELPSLANDTNQGTTSDMRPVIVSPTSPPANFQKLEPEMEQDEYFPSAPPLPPLSYPSESAESHGGYGVLSRLGSERPPAYKPGASGVRLLQFAPRSPPTPIPIPKPSTSYFRKSSSSPPADGKNSTPSSSSSSISPGLWQRLTGITSRNAVDDESPVRAKKMNGLSRILSRRGSTSSSQRPVMS